MIVMDVSVVENWRADDPDQERYLAVLDIHGTLFHADAIAVREVVRPNGVREWVAVNDELQSMVERIQEVDPEGLMKTTELPGSEHQFLIVVTPYLR